MSRVLVGTPNLDGCQLPSSGGAERIRGEMLMLGIHVAKWTIQKYVRAVRPPVPSGQSWSTILKTHGQDIWACDFVPVVTLFFKTLYVFVLVHLGSRRVMPIKVTEHPTDAWVAQQLREATPYGQAPKHLISDNDTKYGPEFHRVAEAGGIDIIHTLYQAPGQLDLRALYRHCAARMSGSRVGGGPSPIGACRGRLRRVLYPISATPGY